MGYNKSIFLKAIVQTIPQKQRQNGQTMDPCILSNEAGRWSFLYPMGKVGDTVVISISMETSCVLLIYQCSSIRLTGFIKTHHKAKSPNWKSLFWHGYRYNFTGLITDVSGLWIDYLVHSWICDGIAQASKPGLSMLALEKWSRRHFFLSIGGIFLIKLM